MRINSVTTKEKNQDLWRKFLVWRVCTELKRVSSLSFNPFKVKKTLSLSHMKNSKLIYYLKSHPEQEGPESNPIPTREGYLGCLTIPQIPTTDPSKDEELTEPFPALVSENLIFSPPP